MKWLNRLGVAFAAVGASTHVHQLVTEWRFLGRAAALGILTSSSFALLQIFFLLCFLAFVVGLLMRTGWGVLASIFGLTGVLLGYFAWFRFTRLSLNAAATNGLD